MHGYSICVLVVVAGGPVAGMTWVVKPFERRE
jgi:hypothetical protein